MRHPAVHIEPAEGKLGILLVGLGSVSTTFIAGVLAIRQGLAAPVGSLTQLGILPSERSSPDHPTFIRDLVPLAQLDELVFGAWDIFEEDAYAAARTAAVLEPSMLDKLRVPLTAIRPMKAVFDERWVPRLKPVHLKTSRNAREHVEQLRADIQSFRASSRAQRLVMMWCGSTEAFAVPGPAHQTIPAFERALDANDASISPSMLYAYAALAEGVPFVNAAPNLTADIPAFSELAMERQVPLAGKDLKTGQTLLKTIVAPALKARLLGVSGWYSTNILGNRDGLVLEHPDCFHTKEVSKVGVLDSILQPQIHPALYSDICHRVHINYYPPRGDNKEGWDNIDLFGWMNYPMQLKINFLCRDSILAAPLVLDLALLTDLASRAHCSGIQEWLSFYFKSPMHAVGAHVEHDLFIQLQKLHNMLLYLKGMEPVRHARAEHCA